MSLRKIYRSLQVKNELYGCCAADTGRAGFFQGLMQPAHGICVLRGEEDDVGWEGFFFVQPAHGICVLEWRGGRHGLGGLLFFAAGAWYVCVRGERGDAGWEGFFFVQPAHGMCVCERRGGRRGSGGLLPRTAGVWQGRKAHGRLQSRLQYSCNAGCAADALLLVPFLPTRGWPAPSHGYTD
eukprot:364556-Chlamydomonas_euryale.AAC.7